MNHPISPNLTPYTREDIISAALWAHYERSDLDRGALVTKSLVMSKPLPVESLGCLPTHRSQISEALLYLQQLLLEFIFRAAPPLAGDLTELLSLLAVLQQISARSEDSSLLVRYMLSDKNSEEDEFASIRKLLKGLQPPARIWEPGSPVELAQLIARHILDHLGSAYALMASLSHPQAESSPHMQAVTLGICQHRHRGLDFLLHTHPEHYVERMSSALKPDPGWDDRSNMDTVFAWIARQLSIRGGSWLVKTAGLEARARQINEPVSDSDNQRTYHPAVFGDICERGTALYMVFEYLSTTGALNLALNSAAS